MNENVKKEIFEYFDNISKSMKNDKMINNLVDAFLIQFFSDKRFMSENQELYFYLASIADLNKDKLKTKIINVFSSEDLKKIVEESISDWTVGNDRFLLKKILIKEKNGFYLTPMEERLKYYISKDNKEMSDEVLKEISENLIFN